jgi:glycosyltransferase involved in cell wall biosynthesis
MKQKSFKANKKIDLVFVNLNLGMGGIETLILEICKRLDTKKFSPQVCVFEKDGILQNEFEQAGIPVHALERKDGLDVTLPIRLALLLKKIRADIVHTHNHSVWLYGGIAARILNLPLVHTEHTSPDYNKEKWYKIERWLSYITDRITTVSNSVGKFMEERERIASDKITVIHNGIDTKIYSKYVDRDVKRKELNLADSDRIIGNIARFFPNKDHACLLKAFKLVVEKIPSAKLLIAGDGPLRNELLELTEELALTSTVKFLGNRRDIPELLRIFDVFALSSIKEGLPITLLEAMASSVPTVATDVDGNPELVVHNQTGYIVPARDPNSLADKIITLLMDKEKAKRMGEMGRARAEEEFSFEKMSAKYDVLYSSMLNGKRK